jgi:hypothetical protein
MSSLCLLLLLGATPAVRLDGVPERLAYPLADGANVIITATVMPSAPKGVWIALDGGSDGRLALVPAGEGTYQVNLAEPRVRNFLEQAGARGMFRIKAAFDDGRTVSSIGVRYSVRMTTPSVIVFGEKGQLPARNDFYSADEVMRLEVRNAGMGRAIVGSRVWPLARDPVLHRAVLVVTPEIRAAWKSHGRLEIHVPDAEGERRIARLKAVPDALALEGGAAALAIVQRHEARLPGSHGYLTLRIGDITRGGTRVELRTATGKRLIDWKRIDENNALEFEFRGHRHGLTLERQVNFLIGPDFAVFSVYRLDRRERGRIEALLQMVARWPSKLVVGEERYKGEDAEEFLRERWRSLDPQPETLDDFLEQVVRRGGYEVKHHDGKIEEASPALRDLLSPR